MAPASTATAITGRMGTTMRNRLPSVQPLPFLRLQTWLSPTFPTGSYSYSHGLEWAVEARAVHDRASLVDWLAADLRYGSGRNEAILFRESWSSAMLDDQPRLIEIAELSAAFRVTSEFALESAQQASACRSTLSQVWPDALLDEIADTLADRYIPLSLALILGIRCAKQDIPMVLALPAFLQSYVANLVIAGVRLIPLGQTDGQAAIAALEDAVLATSADVATATIHDLGSAAFMVDLASMAHETQYTRLFRS
jgi:urease accessory protein